MGCASSSKKNLAAAEHSRQLAAAPNNDDYNVYKSYEENDPQNEFKAAYEAADDVYGPGNDPEDEDEDEDEEDYLDEAADHFDGRAMGASFPGEDGDRDDASQSTAASKYAAFSSESDLRERLNAFYAHVDPVGVEFGEVKVDELVNWAMSMTPVEAMRMIEQELHMRYGLTLARFEDGERLPGVAVPPRGTGVMSYGRPSVSSLADSVFDDENDETVVRDELSRFFLEHAPAQLATGIDEYLTIFREQGRIAMNVALRNEYGANLTSLQGRPQKKSSFNQQKFGVKVATDGVLSEMARFKRTSMRSATPSISRTSRAGSTVSDSLARKWKRMSNRRNGEDSIPEEHVSVDKCPGFQIDVAATAFGVCKHCGQNRGAHSEQPAITARVG